MGTELTPFLDVMKNVFLKWHRHLVNQYKYYGYTSCPSQIVQTLRHDFRLHKFNQLLGATRSIERISNGNVSVCLGGWLSCHSRHCIKTTTPILKLFLPSGSPIIEAFGTPCADTKFQGETPSSGAFNTREWEKLAIFKGYCRLARKRCEIGRWLLWNVNRKSWVPDLLYNFR